MNVKRLPLLVACLLPASAFSQGSLTPPGAPAPTMKTLDQVEARTPIPGTSAVTILQRGSYYLTGNLTVASGNAITIEANGVTLDLNGFTISSTAPSPTGTGIVIGSFRRNITILNGFIESGVTQSGGVFSGTGFANGINISAGQPQNVLVSGVSVSGVKEAGINLGTGEATFVELCRVFVAGFTGITAGGARGCVVRDSGLNGVQGNTVENCSARVTGSGYGILADSALNCQGSSSGGGTGVVADSATNCRGLALGAGTGINAVSANGCWGFSESATGVQATIAVNCYGTSNGSGTAIFANSVINCYGRSTGTGTGIQAFNALNCYGESTGNGFGMQVGRAQNCFGQSSSGTGLSAFIANSCGGSSVVATHKYDMPP